LDYAGEEGVERSRALGCLKLLRMTDRVLAYEANPRGSPALSSAISCILNMHTPNNGDLEKGSKSQRVDSNPALPFQNLYPLQQLKLRKPIKLRQTYSGFNSQQTQAQAEHHSHSPEKTFSSDPVLCYKYKSDELKDDNHRLQARESHEVTRTQARPSHHQ
jgi:hypothetical protein